MEKKPKFGLRFKYEDDPEILNAWIHGRTGYPMVDACMRCLRAMVSQFSHACHGGQFCLLWIASSWRTIHEPLARLFHDYEPGIHLSQLQMRAGVIGFNAIRFIVLQISRS